MAQVAVVLTHVPGGVGVFELVILHLTHTPREQAVFAAVLLFRLIYFILPLLAAAALLAADPLLERPEHALLAHQVEQMFDQAGAMN